MWLLDIVVVSTVLYNYVCYSVISSLGLCSALSPGRCHLILYWGPYANDKKCNSSGLICLALS